MSNATKTMTNEEQSAVSTYLGLARDEAVIANHFAWLGNAHYVNLHNKRTVEYLQRVAAVLGLELVERHPEPVERAPHPGVDVVNR